MLAALQRELGFRLILQERNQGKGAALRRGFEEVSGELVIIQDADLEYSPEEYPELVQLICEGRADVVYGSRFLGRHRVFMFSHYLGNRIVTLLTNVLYNTMLTDMETCYKVMRTEVVRGMALQSNGFRHRAGDDGEDLQARATACTRSRSPTTAAATSRGRRSRGATAWSRSGCSSSTGSAIEPTLPALPLLAPVPRRGSRPRSRGCSCTRQGRRDSRISSRTSSTTSSPTAPTSGYVAAAIVVANLLKGVGGYFSAYLMADVGQRVVRDVRNTLYRHILDQSAAFFARRSSGQLMSRITNDVGQIQQAVSETVGDLLRESLALVGYIVLLFYYDAKLAIVFLTGAPLVIYPLVRLGQAASQDDAPQPGRAGAPLARERRGVHRTPHRQGVRHRGARGGSLRAGSRTAVPSEHEGDGGARRRCRRSWNSWGASAWRRRCGTGCARSTPRRRSSRPASSRRSSRRCS